MPVTFEEAKKAAEAALAKSEEMGLAVTVAVLDEHADTVVLVRMDGNQGFRNNIAWGKAAVSALWGRSSAAVAERTNTPILEAVNQYRDGLVYWKGAVPITRGDEVLGAVGVSGATSEQDEEIAMAAVATIGGA